MAEVVNLRTARKQKARKNAQTVAVDNRAKFGRTKAEKVRDEKAAKLLSRAIDHAKLDKE